MLAFRQVTITCDNALGALGDDPAARTPKRAVDPGRFERDAEAREATARSLEVDPTFYNLSWIARGGQSNAKLLIEGLRKAGLPE